MKNKFTQKAAALLCSKKALNRARTAHRLLSMTAIIACLAVVPAFADNEALNAVNKLSDTIFALIKAVGLICAGWGVLELGMSVQSHDASQRTQGVLCILGGRRIYFVKANLTRLSSIWSMLTQSPETFHNGAVWNAITKIFTALQGAGYGLLVLFFAMSFFKHTVSFREFRHPEQIIGYLIRFVAAKVLISQGMEVIKLIFKISGSFIGDIAAQMGGLTEIAATLPENIRNAIEDASIIPQIFIYLVSLILSAVVIVLSISLLMTVYGRFFRIYMYVALAPLPMSTFAGELTSRHGRTYMQGLIGACMEAIVIVIACIIFNAFTSVDGSDFPINFGDSGVGLVLTYMVKAADKTVKEMFAL